MEEEHSDTPSSANYDSEDYGTPSIQPTNPLIPPRQSSFQQLGTRRHVKHAAVEIPTSEPSSTTGTPKRRPSILGVKGDRSRRASIICTETPPPMRRVSIAADQQLLNQLAEVSRPSPRFSFPHRPELLRLKDDDCEQEKAAKNNVADDVTPSSKNAKSPSVLIPPSLLDFGQRNSLYSLASSGVLGASHCRMSCVSRLSQFQLTANRIRGDPATFHSFKMKAFRKIAAVHKEKTRRPRWRQRVYAFVTRNKWFDRITLTLILLNCMVLALEDPTDHDNTSTRNQVVYYSEFFFTGCFTIEMLVRIAGLGLYKHSFAYMRDPWNILDAVIVITGLLVIIIGSVQSGSSKADVSGLRALRLLRPLRAVTHVKEVRVIITSLLHSLPHLADVLLLYFFFLLLAGIVALKLWRGALIGRCVPDPQYPDRSPLPPEDAERVCNSRSDIHGFKCPWGYLCTAIGNPNYGKTSFDNLGITFLTLFTVVTTEGWTDVMYNAQDATSDWAALYFVGVILFGSFFVANLTLVMINIAFFESQARLGQQTEDVNLMDSGLEDGASRINSKSSLTIVTEGSSSTNKRNSCSTIVEEDKSRLKRFREHVKRLVLSRPFDLFITIIIILNTIFLASEHYGQPGVMTDILEILNYICTGIFTVETLLKLVAFTPSEFIRDRFNLFDAFIVVMSLLDIIVLRQHSGQRTGVSVLRTFRLLRIFKLAKRFPSLWITTMTILHSVQGVSVLTLLLALIIFIYALLGMQIFGGRFCGLEEPEDYQQAGGDSCPNLPRSNFDHLGNAILTVFQVITGEDWNAVMYNGMRSTSNFSAVYYVSLFIFGNYVMLNLFIAVLISNFAEGREQQEEDEQYYYEATSEANLPPPQPRGYRGKAMELFQTLKNRFDPEPPVPSVSIPLMTVDPFHISSYPAEVREVLNLLHQKKKKKDIADPVVEGAEESAGGECSNGIGEEEGGKSGEEVEEGKEEEEEEAAEEEEAKDEAGQLSEKEETGEPQEVGEGEESEANEDDPSAALPPDICGHVQERLEKASGGEFREYLADKGWVDDDGNLLDNVDQDSLRQAMADWVNDTNVSDHHSAEDEFQEAGSDPELDAAVQAMLCNNEYRLKLLPVVRQFGWRNSTFTTTPEYADLLSELKRALEAVGSPSAVEPLVTSHSILPPNSLSSQSKTTSPQDEEYQVLLPLHSSKSEPYSTALFCIPSAHPVRRWLLALVGHKAFEGIVIALILVSTVTLAMNDPFAAPDEPLPRALAIIDIFLTVCFTVEAALKILAHGFLLHRQSYLRRDPWNRLDFVVVIFSLTALAFRSSDKAQQLSVFRVARTLRPLRFINRSPGLKLVVAALISSIPPIANIALITSMIFAIFGVMGVQFFSGGFYACSDESWGDMSYPLWTNTTAVEAAPTTKAACWRQGYRWENNRNHFDHLGSALLNLFEISTLEGWVNVMHLGVDSVGPNKAPSKNHQPWMALYFLVVVVVGCFFIINLFIGVLIDRYGETRAEIEEQQYSGLTEDQRQWIAVQDLLLKHAKPIVTEQELPPWRRKVLPIIQHPTFDKVVTMCIVLNAVAMGSEHQGQPDYWERVLDVSNLVFIGIFTVEAVFKAAASGLQRYLQDEWNRFDAFIVVVSLVGVLLQGLLEGSQTPLLSVFRVLRLGRLTRVVKTATGVRSLLKTMWKSLPSLVNVAGLLLLLFFLFAVVGVDLFGKVSRGVCTNEHANFDHFGNAILLLLRMCTGEAWQCIMKDFSVDPPYCDPHLGNCGNELVAVLYFTLFMTLGMYVLLNVFIAVILGGYEAVAQENCAILTDDMLNHFEEKWLARDPCGTQMLPATSLPVFLQSLDPPLGAEADPRMRNWVLWNIGCQCRDYNGYVFSQELLILLVEQKLLLPTWGNTGMEIMDPVKWEGVVQSYRKRWRRVYSNVPHFLCDGEQQVILPVLAAMKIQAVWRGKLVRNRVKTCFASRASSYRSIMGGTSSAPNTISTTLSSSSPLQTVPPQSVTSTPRRANFSKSRSNRSFYGLDRSLTGALVSGRRNIHAGGDVLDDIPRPSVSPITTSSQDAGLTASRDHTTHQLPVSGHMNGASETFFPSPRLSPVIPSPMHCQRWESTTQHPSTRL